MKHTLMTVLLALTASCADPIDGFECRNARDCDDGFCVSGTCRELDLDLRTDAGARAFDSAAFEALPDGPTRHVVPAPCRNATPASAANVVLNELLVNVPAGPAGDANGDGIRDPYDDEFVELANLSPSPVDLAGVSIHTNGKLKFVFEPWCLLPGEAVVVFGGGSVGITVSTKAAISDTRFAFPNDGGIVSVEAPGGRIAQVEYERSAPTSLTRTPQLVGRQWVPHTALSPAPFSPGLCPDGSPLTSGCPQPVSSDPPDAGSADAAPDLREQ